MRSSWIRVSLISVTGDLIRNGEDTETQRWRSCEDRGWGGRDVGTSCRDLRSWRRQEGFSPEAFGGSMALLISWFQTPNLQNCERTDFYCLCGPYVETCHGSPGKLWLGTGWFPPFLTIGCKLLGLVIQHQMEGLLCTGPWPQTLMDVSKDNPHPNLHCDQACSSAWPHP